MDLDDIFGVEFEVEEGSGITVEVVDTVYQDDVIVNDEKEIKTHLTDLLSTQTFNQRQLDELVQKVNRFYTMYDTENIVRTRDDDMNRILTTMSSIGFYPVVELKKHVDTKTYMAGKKKAIPMVNLIDEGIVVKETTAFLQERLRLHKGSKVVTEVDTHTLFSPFHQEADGFPITNKQGMESFYAWVYRKDSGSPQNVMEDFRLVHNDRVKIVGIAHMQPSSSGPIVHLRAVDYMAFLKSLRDSEDVYVHYHVPGAITDARQEKATVKRRLGHLLHLQTNTGRNIEINLLSLQTLFSCGISVSKTKSLDDLPSPIRVWTNNVVLFLPDAFTEWDKLLPSVMEWAAINNINNIHHPMDLPTIFQLTCSDNQIRSILDWCNDNVGSATPILPFAKIDAQHVPRDSPHHIRNMTNALLKQIKGSIDRAILPPKATSTVLDVGPHEEAIRQFIREQKKKAPLRFLSFETAMNSSPRKEGKEAIVAHGNVFYYLAAQKVANSCGEMILCWVPDIQKTLAEARKAKITYDLTHMSCVVPHALYAKVELQKMLREFSKTVKMPQPEVKAMLDQHIKLLKSRNNPGYLDAKEASFLDDNFGDVVEGDENYVDLEEEIDNNLEFGENKQEIQDTVEMVNQGNEADALRFTSSFANDVMTSIQQALNIALTSEERALASTFMNRQVDRMVKQKKTELEGDQDGKAVAKKQLAQKKKIIVDTFFNAIGFAMIFAQVSLPIVRISPSTSSPVKISFAGYPMESFKARDNEFLDWVVGTMKSVYKDSKQFPFVERMTTEQLREEAKIHVDGIIRFHAAMRDNLSAAKERFEEMIIQTDRDNQILQQYTVWKSFKPHGHIEQDNPARHVQGASAIVRILHDKVKDERVNKHNVARAPTLINSCCLHRFHEDYWERVLDDDEIRASLHRVARRATDNASVPNQSIMLSNGAPGQTSLKDDATLISHEYNIGSSHNNVPHVSRTGLFNAGLKSLLTTDVFANDEVLSEVASGDWASVSKRLKHYHDLLSMCLPSEPIKYLKNMYASTEFTDALSDMQLFEVNMVLCTGIAQHILAFASLIENNHLLYLSDGLASKRNLTEQERDEIRNAQDKRFFVWVIGQKTHASIRGVTTDAIMGLISTAKGGKSDGFKHLVLLCYVACKMMHAILSSTHKSWEVVVSRSKTSAIADMASTMITRIVSDIKLSVAHISVSEMYEKQREEVKQKNKKKFEDLDNDMRLHFKRAKDLGLMKLDDLPERLPEDHMPDVNGAMSVLTDHDQELVADINSYTGENADGDDEA